MEKLKLIKCWKIVLLLIGMSLFSGTIFAQGITIRGKVVDSKGESLIGATVRIKATPATATTTNISGDFSLRVPANTTMITVSYVGYVSVDVPVTAASGNLGQIPLANDANTLSDVVVVGYGVQNKRDITGAITEVDAKSLAEVPSTNIVDQLKGKVAGVDIQNVGGGLGSSLNSAPAIHIRGNRTIGKSVSDGADQPLIVVDGIPYTGGLNDINPEDIKNLEILKDASATAIYGSRGSGGVILVTTNRGRVGKTITALNAYYGVEKILGALKVMNGPEYAQYKADALQGSALQGSGSTAAYPLSPVELAGVANGTNTNWQGLLYQDGYVADQNLSISGGSEATTYNVGAGYRVETGVEPNQRRERYSLQTVIDQKISKAIRVGVNVTNTLSYLNLGAGFQGANAAQVSPLVPAFNGDGSLNSFPYIGQLDATYTSPLLAKYNGGAFYNNARAFHNFTSMFAELTIMKDLKYRVSFGYDFTQTLSGTYNGINANSTIQTQAQTTASTNNSDGYHYTLDNLLTYDKTFARKHHITINALFSTEKNHTDSNGINAQGIPEDVNLNSNLSLGTFTSDSGSQSEYGLISEMARFNYSFDGRMALTATVRSDANSDLAPGHQRITYPAIGAAWTITNEKWMQQFNFIDNLKLRAGYGVTSNGALAEQPYQTLGGLASSNTSGVTLKYEYGGVTTGNANGLLVSSLQNPTLGFQKTAEFNLGIDFGLLKDRITGVVDVYTEKTTGIIFGNVLPPTDGAPTPPNANLGTSADKGLEIAISSINIQNKGGFSWTTDFNIAFSRERIVSLPNGILANIGAGEFVGHPLNVIYDLKKIGIWQTGDPGLLTQTSPKQYAGQIKVQDVDGNGIINASDNQIIGTYQPQYTGGITNRFVYKNVDLSIVIAARMGMLTAVPYLSSGGSTGGWAFFGTGRHNQPKVDYWTPTNPTNAFPEPNQNLQSFPFASTLQYYDGSWIKARSINLGYTFAPRLLSHAGISSLRVYVNCTNPFIIYSPLVKAGYATDPEGNSVGATVSGNNGANSGSGGNNRQTSVNYTSDPTTRNFLLGINLKF